MQRKKALAFTMALALLTSTASGTLVYAKDEHQLKIASEQESAGVADKAETPKLPEELRQTDGESEETKAGETKAGLVDGAGDYSAEAAKEDSVPEEENARGKAQNSDGDTAVTAAAAKTVYLDFTSGDDTNNGETTDKPLKTLDRATALAGDNGTVVLKSTVQVTTAVTLGNNITFRRGGGMKGSLFQVTGGGTLTIDGATLDGDKANQPSSSGDLVELMAGKLFIQKGKLCNNDNGAIHMMSQLGSVYGEMNGGEIYNVGRTKEATTTAAEAGYGVTLFTGRDTTKFVMNGGSIHDVDGVGVFVQDEAVFEMNDGAIKNNTAHSWMNGAAVNVSSQGRFTMNGGELSGNRCNGNAAQKGVDGGAIGAIDNATVNLLGGTISGNVAKESGGAIYAAGATTVTVDGATISGNTGSYGGAISTQGTASLTIAESTGKQTLIAENNATDPDIAFGGGIAIGGGTLNITGGSISGNTGGYGGGVGLWGNNATITMSGGKVSDNKGVEYGGGFYVSAVGASFSMSGGIISGNNGDVGGGVIISRSAFNMTGGKIINNTAGSGGGLSIQGAASRVTVSETTTASGVITPEISGNIVTGPGGGVGISDGEIVLNGALITGNKAGYGSGIGIWNNATATMKGNTIVSGNIANGFGGAVYVSAANLTGSKFIMQGGEIKDNLSEQDAYPYGVIAYGGAKPVTAEIKGGKISNNLDENNKDRSILVLKGKTAPNNATLNMGGTPTITGEVCLRKDLDASSKINITEAFTPATPVLINTDSASWKNNGVIVSYANALTPEVSDFAPYEQTEKRYVIQNGQDLQSMNKIQVLFQEKDVYGKYGEAYVKVNELITDDQIPSATKVGYELTGWKNAKTDTDWNFATDTVTEDTVLYPVWKLDERYYTVKYETGSRYATIADMRVKDGNKARKPELTWAGRTLQGWYTTADFQDGTLWDFESPVKGNMTLHAKWVLNAPTVAVDADNAAAGKVTVHTGDKVVLTATASHEAEKGITFSYTWYKDGKEIKAKATGRGVSEQNRLEVEEAGTYSVKVTADDGTLTSAQVESNSLEVVVTGHDFGEWVIVKQPTETEKGLKERTCKICNLKESEEIPATGKKEEPKPEDPKPGTSKPGDAQKTENTVNTTTIRKVVKSVKTGDTTGLGMAVGAMAMALAAGAGVVIKRKKRS